MSMTKSEGRDKLHHSNGRSTATVTGSSRTPCSRRGRSSAQDNPQQQKVRVQLIWDQTAFINISGRSDPEAGVPTPLGSTQSDSRTVRAGLNDLNKLGWRHLFISQRTQSEINKKELLQTMHVKGNERTHSSIKVGRP